MLRRLLRKYHGYEVVTEGDSFLVAFHLPIDALAWCAAVQQVSTRPHGSMHPCHAGSCQAPDISDIHNMMQTQSIAPGLVGSCMDLNCICNWHHPAQCSDLWNVHAGAAGSSLACKATGALEHRNTASAYLWPRWAQSLRACFAGHLCSCYCDVVLCMDDGQSKQCPSYCCVTP